MSTPYAPAASTRPSPARKRLLDAATDLFYSEGIHSVGVDRIIEAAGVTRATMYKQFDGKEGLVLAYLRGEDEGLRALFAEALHSLVDTLNQVFLFLGIALEARPASPKHPFGHGKERFFWSFVAAIFIFATGAVISIHEGLAKWRHPAPIEAPGWAFAIATSS